MSRHGAGNAPPAPCSMPVGEDESVSPAGGSVSGVQEGRQPLPERQPYSPPFTTWTKRGARYQGAPMSHSMSLS